MRVPGDGHVDHIVGAHIEFRNTARAFDDDKVVRRAQPVQSGGHRAPQLRPVFLVERGRAIAEDSAHEHDLARSVGSRFQKERVHVRGGRDTRGLRLQSLSTPDLGSVGAHRGIVGEVLTLERRHADSLPGEDAAKSRHQQALACRGT